MRRKVIFWASLVLTIATLVMIWYFSSQMSSETSALSGGLARKIAEWFGGVWNVNKTEAVLRKMAHFGIFMLLGVGLTGMLVTQNRFPVVSIVVFLGTLFAAIDEVHQSFVPGRSPRVTDVLIDLGGVVVGMLIVMLAEKSYCQRQRKK